MPVINKWVSDKTKGLITEIVQAPLDPGLVMMLINALYFKGTWSQAFDPKSSYNGTFYLADGSEKPCRMMNGKRKQLRLNDGKTLGLEVPYGDSLFSMVFLQPVDSLKLSDLIHSLEAGAWNDMRDKFKVHEGTISIPKFKLEYGKSLGNTLQAMGMNSAFGGSADFSGISKTLPLQISEVIHKTFVSVDEAGTEAAAVTEVGIKSVSIEIDPLQLNRPFVMLIQEKTSGAVLFLGRIMDPGL